MVKTSEKTKVPRGDDEETFVYRSDVRLSEYGADRECLENNFPHREEVMSRSPGCLFNDGVTALQTVQWREFGPNAYKRSQMDEPIIMEQDMRRIYPTHGLGR